MPTTEIYVPDYVRFGSKLVSPETFNVLTRAILPVLAELYSRITY